MTMPLREQHINAGTTTLNGSISPSSTTITVTDGSVFPSTGNFRVIVDYEIMVCTSRSGNTLTVVRGAEGTSATSHANGATINMVYTKGGFARLMQDNEPLWGYSNRKPLSKIVADDGETILTSSDFTWQNQGGASVVDDYGTIYMIVPKDSGENLRVKELTPSSPPYSYIAAMSFAACATDSNGTPGFGLGFRESTSNKASIIECRLGTTTPTWCPKIDVQRYTNLSLWHSIPSGTFPLMLVNNEGLIWFKIENDNTNLKYYISGDGWTWIEFFSESKTAFFTSGPNRVFWFGRNVNNSDPPAVDAIVRLHHWSRGE
jgi:hypothetical protein